jgi:hypothetical protein
MTQFFVVSLARIDKCRDSKLKCSTTAPKHIFSMQYLLLSNLGRLHYLNYWHRFLIYIQQDATLQGLFYLETSLHVCTTTHHQERKQLYLQHLVFVTPLLLSAAIVEELESVWVRHPQHIRILLRCTDPWMLTSRYILGFYDCDYEMLIPI